jgi:ADP-ribose pyrophosphatase YjhB (NUDIX family)
MPPQSDDARDLEKHFFDSIAERGSIRIAVRALVILDDNILVQRLNHAESIRWFPGGEVEFGEPLEAAIRRELREETSIHINTVTYRFVANNTFERNGDQFHFLEHYFEVTPADLAVDSIEDHFDHEWIPISRAGLFDIRPIVVRDVLRIPGWRNIRLLETD